METEMNREAHSERRTVDRLKGGRNAFYSSVLF